MTYTPLEREDGTELSVRAKTTKEKPHENKYEKIDQSYFCAFNTRPDAGLLLKRDDGEYNASDHYDRSNHASPRGTKSAHRLPGHGAGAGDTRGLLNVHKEVFQTGLREISFLTS